jgi:hypothetical protein
MITLRRCQRFVIGAALVSVASFPTRRTDLNARARMRRDSEPFEILDSTLGKIYSIEKSHVTVTPNPGDPRIPRYCWVFYRPESVAYKRIREAVESYHAAVQWIYYGSDGESCIAAWNQKHLSPSESVQFVEEALSDVPALSEHIEKARGLEARMPNRMNSNFDAPPSESETPDFSEPGTHVVWIVQNPVQFAKGQHVESADAKRLHFGVNDKEWAAIHSDVFRWAANVPITEQDDTESRNFPMLASIAEYESATFDSTEIEELRRECLRARAAASKRDAILGLDKLMLMCNWARKLNRGLYLMGP